MTTEIQTPTINQTHLTNNSTIASANAGYSSSILTKLQDSKGNVIKPLSLRPNRSIKKNISLKPLGLRSR